MSSGSLIPQALLLISLLMPPQCAKLDNERKKKKKKKEERKEVEEGKKEMEEAFKKEVKFVVIYDHEPLVQGHSGRIFWHPRYLSMS